MKCVVTAGPTYEELDEARRLTNFSTGRLGSELACFLESQGHEVKLLLGYHSTWRKEENVKRTQIFTTTNDLREKLRALSNTGIDAVFHAAAVSDFRFGKIWRRQGDDLAPVEHSAKLSTRDGALLAELVPTPKIISELRGWFPTALIVGWKYELVGDRAFVIHLAERQIKECQTNGCVANGKAYGAGFGLVTGVGQATHVENEDALFQALANLLKTRA